MQERNFIQLGLTEAGTFKSSPTDGEYIMYKIRKCTIPDRV